MMDDHPDLRHLGGSPVRYVEIQQPFRDQLFKSLAGLASTVMILLLVLAVPLTVLLYRAAF